jgi:hypothetical protein
MLAEFRSPGFLRKIWQEEVQILDPNYAGGGTTVEAFWKTLIANIGEGSLPLTTTSFTFFHTGACPVYGTIKLIGSYAMGASVLLSTT